MPHWWYANLSVGLQHTQNLLNLVRQYSVLTEEHTLQTIWELRRRR